MAGTVSGSLATVAAAAPRDAPPPSIDPQGFRRVLGRFATGVTVLSCRCDGRPVGMTLSAFLSVSLQPPLVLVSIRGTSRLVPHLGVGARFGVNVLAEHQRHLASHFAGRPRVDADLRYIGHEGVPLLAGSLAHVVARVTAIHPAGDHFLFIAAVEHLLDGPDAVPLIFFAGRYQPARAHGPTT